MNRLNTNGLDESEESLTHNKKKKLKPWFWSYFAKVSSESACCDICQKVLSIKGGSTSTCKRHLKRHNILSPQDYTKIYLRQQNEDNNNFCGSKRENKSWVLDYFRKLPENKFKCKFCYKVIAGFEAETVGMEAHLRDHHNISRDVEAEPAKCYICNCSVGIDRYEMNTCASFTETPIYEILVLMTGQEITPQDKQTSAICKECFDLLDSYDELRMKAREIQKNVTSLFHKKHRRISQPRTNSFDCNENSQPFAKDPLKIEPCENTDIAIRDINKREDEPSETDLLYSDTTGTNDESETTFTHEQKFHVEDKKARIKDERKFRCDKCSKSFVRKNILEIHLAADHGPPNGPFECFICFKTYKNQNTLRSHYYVHKEERNHLCVM